MIVAFASSAFMMADEVLCPKNCSGNGDCLSGTCLCQVQYTGWACSDCNIGYYITFGILFCLISFTTVVQLILRIYMQIKKSPSPSLYTACKPDIQKLIYLFVICATSSRALYFILGMYDVSIVPDVIKSNLFTVFYPFVLTGFSLVICIWAESFHLSGLQLDKPRFLTKSFFGFLAFNVVVYSMWIGQIISNNVLDASLANRMNAIFNSGFAFLMFFVLVFFLIYGVEIFCKVKGAFKRSPSSDEKHVNVGQLYQSRMGLCVQACFQLVVMFLMSEVLGEMWKTNMSVGDKNVVDIAFHLAELACILWFPCTLWNVNQPGKLWILNPQNLLNIQSGLHEDMCIVSEAPRTPPECQDVVDEQCTEEDGKFIAGESECWICYDKERNETLIQPCNCKGDMKLVHHNCLKVWLVEKSATSGGGGGAGEKSLACDVCKEEYRVISDGRLFWTPNKVQFRAWAQTILVIITMASLPVILFSVWHEVHQAVAKTALVIFLFLGEYCLLRLLGFNFVKAYNITRTRALRILGKQEFMDKTCTSRDTRDTSEQFEVENIAHVQL